ncbi:MAG: DUF4386 family protein [Peptococcaceae bacterium]|nr:MAG: DUF4386 family protein [Peptococcaceae bacterium]
MSSLKQNQVADAETADSAWKTLYKVAGVAALVAMSANLLDVILGFGETEIFTYGAKTATDWFALFRDNWFKGLYTLGILNIVYMTCMAPIYYALYGAHRRKNSTAAALAMILFLVGMTIYISNNAAIPMLVLSGKYAAAATDAQRTLFAAAGEAVLAQGEDFTPGSFIGLILSGIAAITISIVMLRGRIFGKPTAWIGIAGFSFLSMFTILSTFVPALYLIAFYVFGMIGGLLALSWFLLVARRFFQLGRLEKEELVLR